MEKRNMFNKITGHSYDIVFGILSGTGLFFLSWEISSLVVYLIQILNKYFLIIYIALHLFTLIGTAKMYTRGLFRAVYVISSLVLLFVYVFTKTSII